MSYSIDVNGNDNTPEWGYCTIDGCREEAFPIWQSGGFPDEPDHLLCPKHIGLLIGKLETQRRAWTAIGAKAQADAAALHTLLDDAITLCHIPEHNQDAQWYARFEAIIVAFHEEHPGAQLLTEIEAARKFIRAISGAMLIGGWSDEQSALLTAYDAAVKASE